MAEQHLHRYESQQSQLRKKERNSYSVQPNDDMGALS